MSDTSNEFRLVARNCLECGTVVTHETAEFCKTECRKTWNNRRLVRGAEIYDLFMALRHERKLAYGMGLWTLISRAATLYREEDHRDRAGRRSWGRPQTVIDRRPYLKTPISKDAAT